MHMTSDKCWPGLGGKNSLLAAYCLHKCRAASPWHHCGLDVYVYVPSAGEVRTVKVLTGPKSTRRKGGLAWKVRNKALGPGICISFPEWAVVRSHVLLPSQLEAASLTFELHALLVWGSLKTDLKSFQAHDSFLALSLSLSSLPTFTHNNSYILHLQVDI